MAEYKFFRSDAEEALQDEGDSACSAEASGGRGDIFHRLGAIIAFWYRGDSDVTNAYSTPFAAIGVVWLVMHSKSSFRPWVIGTGRATAETI
jgi:hypothetical protein